LAKIAVQEQRFSDATRILQAVHDSLAGKPVPVVGQALIEIAKVLELQGRCANAQKVLKYVLSDLPKVPAAKQARDLLATSATRCKEGVGVAGKPAEDASKGAEPAVPAKEKAPSKPSDTPTAP
jgi:hypothetical protein